MATVGDLKKLLEGKDDDQIVEIAVLQANIVVHEKPSEPVNEATAETVEGE